MVMTRSDCDWLCLFLYICSYNYFAPEWKKSSWEHLTSCKKTYHRKQQCPGNHHFLTPLNTTHVKTFILLALLLKKNKKYCITD